MQATRKLAAASASPRSSNGTTITCSYRLPDHGRVRVRRSAGSGCAASELQCGARRAVQRARCSSACTRRGAPSGMRRRVELGPLQPHHPDARSMERQACVGCECADCRWHTGHPLWHPTPRMAAGGGGEAAAAAPDPDAIALLSATLDEDAAAARVGGAGRPWGTLDPRSAAYRLLSPVNEAVGVWLTVFNSCDPHLAAHVTPYTTETPMIVTRIAVARRGASRPQPGAHKAPAHAAAPAPNRAAPARNPFIWPLCGAPRLRSAFLHPAHRPSGRCPAWCSWCSWRHTTSGRPGRWWARCCPRSFARWVAARLEGSEEGRGRRAAAARGGRGRCWAWACRPAPRAAARRRGRGPDASAPLAPQVLKRAINERRPASARKQDPGMPSSHANSEAAPRATGATAAACHSACCAARHRARACTCVPAPAPVRPSPVRPSGRRAGRPVCSPRAQAAHRHAPLCPAPWTHPPKASTFCRSMRRCRCCTTAAAARRRPRSRRSPWRPASSWCAAPRRPAKPPASLVSITCRCRMLSPRS